MTSDCINNDSEFFAEVLRPPLIRSEGNGKFRLRLFDARRFFAEFAIVGIIGFLFFLWFSHYVGRWANLVFAVLLTGYAVAAWAIKRMDDRTRIEINGRRLFLGADRVECVGTIEEVLCVDLSGHEDKHRWESGSSRIYVVIQKDNDTVVLPLLISSTDLRPAAKRLASALACRYREGRGPASIPKEVRSWKTGKTALT